MRGARKERNLRMEPEAKERLGTKWTCYSCGIKFYDLKKPEPTCPKCQADQRESPAPEKKPTRAKRATKKKKTTRKKTTARKARVSLAALDDDNETIVKPDEDKVKPIDEIDPSEAVSEVAADE